MALIERIRLERIWLIAYNDFRVRYYESYLGILWALINPILKTLAFYFVFTLIFNVAIPNFAFYIYIGMIIWSFFTETTKKLMRIYLSKGYLLGNVNIPKTDIHIAACLSVFLGFLLNLFVFFLMAVIFQIPQSWHLVLLPLLLLTLILFTIAVGMIISIVFSFIHDFENIWDFVMLIGMWFMPIFYGREILLKRMPLLHANPLCGVMINIREIVLYARAPHYFFVFYDLIVSILAFVLALLILSRYSKYVVEKI